MLFERRHVARRVRDAWDDGARRATATLHAVGAFALLPALVGALHLVEVHLLDAGSGAFARAATGLDFLGLSRLEAPLTRAIAESLGPQATAALVGYYLLAFVALLAWAPFLVASSGDARLVRRTTLGYAVIYALALPFYLFFPSPNPYVAAGGPDPFETVHPRLDDLYYTLTTRDNTFPSLHVAFTALLVARILQARLPGLLGPTLATHGALLIASVVLVRVHYVADVVGGLLLALVALRLSDRLDARLAPLPHERAAPLDADDAMVRDA